MYSGKREETERFKDGKNPPILAAIRYLAKLTQYLVTGTPEDMALVTKIIAETKPEEFTAYVKKKLEEFGLKALLNSPDVEFAWNLLESSGARKLLMDMDGNRISAQNSLSWWMNKEPLRSVLVGQGSGKTAKEIFRSHLNENGEIIVAHETNSFIAYENITRSAEGSANVFISRDKITGEAAILGDGFYTQLGQKGARGTNLTIRFKLHPDAVEGRDFTYENSFIVVKNKKALTLIQENLNLSVVDFLKLVINGDIDKTDRGLIEKFKRKFNRSQTDKEDFKHAKDLLKSHFFIAEDFPEEHRFDFSKIDALKNFDELLNFYMDERIYYQGLVQIFDFKGHPEWVEAIINKGGADREIALFVLSQEHWKDRPEWVEMLIDKGTADIEIAAYVLLKEHWNDHPKLVEKLISKGTVDKTIAAYVLLKEHWKDHSEWVELLIDTGAVDWYIAAYVLLKEHWSYHPDFLLYLNSDEVTLEGLKRRFKEISFSDWMKKGHSCSVILSF